MTTVAVIAGLLGAVYLLPPDTSPLYGDTAVTTGTVGGAGGVV